MIKESPKCLHATEKQNDVCHVDTLYEKERDVREQDLFTPAFNICDESWSLSSCFFLNFPQKEIPWHLIRKCGKER